MRLINGHVLLRITAADKKEIFQEDIEGLDGNLTTLFKQIEQEEGLGTVFEQTVQTAEVVAVAPDVKHIQPGDIAIIDYIVDTLKEAVVYEDELGKLLCIDTRTEFHDEDNIVYATGKTRQDVFAWSKGDVDQASLIYAVFRDDRLIPNPPYVICEHKDYEIVTGEGGIHHSNLDEDGGTCMRKVLVPNEFSDPYLEPGTFVVVENFCLYEREMYGKKFDVIMDQDIEVAI
jgi:hypothetical protein